MLNAVISKPTARSSVRLEAPGEVALDSVLLRPLADLAGVGHAECHGLADLPVDTSLRGYDGVDAPPRPWCATVEVLMSTT